MKYIRTPTGDVFRKDECVEFDDNFDNSEVFFDAEDQKRLAKRLFENTGILVSELKGGENTG